MVEQTTEMLIESCTSCCVTCTSSNEPSLLTPLSIIVGMIITTGGLMFSIYKHYKAQKENTDKRIEVEKQFNETQNAKKNFELENILRNYQNDIHELMSKSPEGPVYFASYRQQIIQFLTILNRISYLTKIETFQPDVAQYFEYYFNIGITNLKWLEEIEGGTYDTFSKSFVEISKILEYTEESIKESNIQRYYRKKKEADKNYDPYKDENNPELPE